jgi:hypothetical protein
LVVDDEPFHVGHGRLLARESVLDLRAGVLRRRGCPPASPGSPPGSGTADYACLLTSTTRPVQLRLRDRSGASLSVLLYGERVDIGPL